MPVSEYLPDQAAGLRRIARTRPVKTIAVTGGKGGVGKTSVSVNLGIMLAKQGMSAMLLDADLGLANVDVLLGLNSRYDLSHVISGESTLEEIILNGPAGLKVIPASSGKDHMARLGAVEHGGLIRAFGDLSQDVEILLVDTAAGINESVVTFSRAANEVVVVVCDEPASITDAYGLIKVLNRQQGVDRFHVLANMTDAVHQGQELYHRLTRVTQRFLDVTLNYLGAIPRDDYMRKAVRRQQAVVDAYPRSRASLAFRKMADKISRWPVTGVTDGGLEFFVERLILSS